MVVLNSPSGHDMLEFDKTCKFKKRSWSFPGDVSLVFFSYFELGDPYRH